MKESPVLHHSLLALSEAGHLAWRNNTGIGWAGQAIKPSRAMNIVMQPGDVLIRNARPLHAGLCVGSADIIGLRSDGRFYGIECKSDTGRQSKEQKIFGDVVISHGGLYGIARSPEEALKIIGET